MFQALILFFSLAFLVVGIIDDFSVPAAWSKYTLYISLF